MSIDSELQKGAFVNFLGVIGKVATPLFLILVNRLYGPDVFGIYITAMITVEIVIAFLTSGFKDGALIFVARYADDKGEQTLLYRSLCNAFGWSIGFSVIVLIFGFLFGERLLEFIYADDFNAGLFIVFKFMLFAIPFMAFERVVLAATQGLKIMKYDALSNGWIRPIALLFFAVFFWFIYPDLKGIALAYLCTQLTLFLISVWVYSRQLSWKKLWYGFRNFSVDKQLLDFAIPQNINMTLNRFITGIDVLMLPAFGFNATTVGFYGAGAMIIREIKAIKGIFSTAFSPFIVRFHKESETEKLSHNFSRTAGWIATLTIPVLLLIAVFKQDLLSIIHPEYGGTSTFMYFLLLIPYSYCSFSLAGNIVAMTGHSKLTLLNSLFVSALNIILNFTLIPILGITGAAISSATAMILLNILEVWEANYIAGAKLYFKEIYKPHLAALISSGAFILLINTFPLLSYSVQGKIVLSLITLGIYSLVLGTSHLKKLIAKIRELL